MAKQSKRSFKWATGALALLTASLVSAQSYEAAANQGRILNAAAAEQIESSLMTNPHDLQARARLLGYYSLRAGQDPTALGARLRQVEWLIKNEPSSLLLRHDAARLRSSDFAAPYGAYLESLRSAWQEQVNQQPDNAVIIENAWQSLGSAETAINGGERQAGYLKRLRVLEPGDPQWALDLAGLYAMALTRGMPPNAPSNAKQSAATIQAELEKSSDVAVIGLTGELLYGSAPKQPNQPAIAQAIAPLVNLSESLLRRAAALNPKNPAWASALAPGSPSNSAGLGATLTSMLQITDLWPGGVAPLMALPAGAIRMSAEVEAARRPALTLEGLPLTAAGTGCSVQFDALIGRDGQVRNLQVVAFDRLNIPFIAAQRDALRQAHYPPMLVAGQPAEVVAKIDATCPKQAPTTTGVPGGVVGGIPGGLVGGVSGGPIAAPPPPPPPPKVAEAQPNGTKAQRIGGNVMLAKRVKVVQPVYPPLAKNARIQGSVRFTAVIAKDGTIQKLELLSGHPLLVEAARNAASQWTYQPTLIDGEPVEVLTEITLTFTLQ